MAFVSNKHDIKHTHIEYVDRYGYHTFKLEATPANKATGKYIFFCKYKDILVDIAKDQLYNNGFFKAKIKYFPDEKIHFMMIFYHNSSRLSEFNLRFANDHYVKFRGWKTGTTPTLDTYIKKHPRRQEINPGGYANMGMLDEWMYGEYY